MKCKGCEERFPCLSADRLCVHCEVRRSKLLMFGYIFHGFPPGMFGNPDEGGSSDWENGPNADRNEWCYHQFRDHPQKKIREIRAEAKQKGWILGSDQTFRKAVKSHCDSLEIDMPKRKQKRNEPK